MSDEQTKIIAKLQAEVNSLVAGIEKVNDVAVKHRRENIKLLAALEKYGWHLPTCPISKYFNRDEEHLASKTPCTCGFDAAKREHNE